MRTVLGAALALAMAGAATTGAAIAADFPASPYYTAPTAYSAYSWAGPYIGGTVGYEWGSVDNNPTRPSGIEGGIEGGFNWQHGNFVYGGEADFNLSGAEDTFAPWQFSNPWFGTVRGRAGVAVGNVLIYGTAASAGWPAAARKSASCRIGRPRPSGSISTSPIAAIRSPAPITGSPPT
jgi:outer membrane immunogenic protein